MTIQIAPRALQVWNRVRGATRPPVAHNLAGGDASLTLYGVVGDEITDRDVAAALDALAGARSLTLYVNSPGGDYFVGKAIFAQLARFAAGVPVVAHVDALAASAASLLIMAAGRIEMEPEATLMVHEVQALGWGRAADLEAMAAVVRTENENLAAIYARRSGLALDRVAAMLDAETWMTAPQALELGFCDGVCGPPLPVAMPGMDPARMDPKAQAAEPAADPVAAQTLRRIADAHACVARALTARR